MNIINAKTTLITITGVFLAGVALGGLLVIYAPPVFDTPELFNIKGKYTVRCDKPDGTREVIEEVSVWEGNKGTMHYVNLADRKTIKLGNECILYNIGLL